MPDEDKVKRASEIEAAIKEHDAKKRADEEHHGQVLDKLLSRLDGVMNAVENMSARVDALESDRADAKKRDDAKRKRKSDAGDDDDAKDDHHYGDDDEGFAEQPTQGDDDPTKEGVQMPLMAKPTVTDSRADAQRRLELALSEAQERADQACLAWGSKAKPPMMAEDLLDYRKRLLRPHMRHSKDFANIDVDGLFGPLLDSIEARVYADSRAKAAHADVAENQLRMISKTLPSGHRENTFHGSPLVWFQQCGAVPRNLRYLTKIRTKFDND
jgi:hypothetical protein